jgi:ferric-dicitrate binding protein FerR (iron transport regulator)
MQHSQAYYKALLAGFIRNTITIDQVNELYLFIDQEPETYARLMSDPDILEITEQNADQLPVELSPAADQRIWERLQTYAENSVQDKADRVTTFSVLPVPNRRRRLKRVAAAVLLIAGITTLLIVFSGRWNSASHQPVVSQLQPADVTAPRVTQATVTLANGQQIALDSLAKGLLAQQGNVKLVKTENGQISYQTTSGEIIRELQYNTLHNPRGSKVIDIALNDGSHVWLNAGSSLTYPVAFIGRERKVTITGEAYFEVAHDASKPFYVSKGNVEVKVLGTHFNVLAYDDEAAIKVTLLQGSVLVKQSATNSHVDGNKQSAVLKPGEQAIAANQSTITIYHSPDLEQVMAWKDGLFNFNKVSLQEVMHQLARWYNVEVEYQGAVTNKTLGGEMQRDLSLSEVLDGLKSLGVHARIEGKKILVMP